MTRIRQHHWLISVKLEDLWVSLCPIERFDLYAGDPFPVVFLARDMTHVFYKKLVYKKLVLKMDEMLRNRSGESEKY